MRPGTTVLPPGVDHGVGVRYSFTLAVLVEFPRHATRKRVGRKALPRRAQIRAPWRRSSVWTSPGGTSRTALPARAASAAHTPAA